MLLVTADIFSGRPNPAWLVEDEDEVREILKVASGEGAQAMDVSDGEALLGYRGLILECMNDDLADVSSLAASGPMRIPASMIRKNRALAALSERLLGHAGGSTGNGGNGVQVLGDQLLDIKQLLTEEEVSTRRVSQLDMDGGGCSAPLADAEEQSGEVGAQVVCTIELAAYNPGFWNNNATTRARNNCYNYASNRVTNTFAQPGRGASSIYRALTCAEVSRASLADGLRRRGNCFPASEKPRYLVALVIWPGRDFHWYRKNHGGSWSHKPGSTAARNTDNSNRVITNPETCNRGPYTQFCGYFYTRKSQRIQ